MDIFVQISIWSEMAFEWCLFGPQVLTNLESETGMDPGWINNGGLFIANNKVSQHK